jgi:hypothetical protein
MAPSIPFRARFAGTSLEIDNGLRETVWAARESRHPTMALPRQRSQAAIKVLGRVATERLVTGKNLRPSRRVEPRQPGRT